MGYAGQLSLGHALYVGLGGYVAALLWLDFGIGPWLGVFAAIAVAAAFGAAIGWLGFRFGIAGVYFALLTIAFARVHPHRASIISRFTGGCRRPVPALRGSAHRRVVEPARRAAPVLLSRRSRSPPARVRAGGAAGALAARLSVARGARGRDGGARARHRRVSRQDDGGADLVRHDRGRRRVLRLLLQQPVSRRRCSTSRARSR